MSEQTMAAAAVELAAAGWSVFPCKWRGATAKAPLTQNGFHDATSDLEQVRAWWSRWPKAMIGAPVPSTLLVLDVDPRNGGSIEGLEDVLGPLPATLTAWSGRGDGGRHLYYFRPVFRPSAARLPSGIDLKLSGYCIVPPSVHPATGRPYVWEHHPIAALPPRALAALRPRPVPARTVRTRTGRGSGAGLVRTVQESSEGNRNEALFWAACRAVEDGLPESVLDELTAAAVANGLPERAVANTVKSARKLREAS